MQEFDVVVVGGGFAGLLAAVHFCGLRVAVVHKGPWGSQTSSELALGGIAAAMADTDHVELHALDTIAAGAGLCDPAVVRSITAAGPDVIRRLEAFGLDIDRTASGFDLKLEAAHSRARVVSAGKTNTGRVLTQFMNELAIDRGVHHLDGTVVGLLQHGQRVVGVQVRDGQECNNVFARAVVLATGSSCGLWRDHSVPDRSRGVGISLAHAVGAQLADLEFVQFHPTGFASSVKPQLLSEALRGAGARIVDGTGHRFVSDDHPSGELAPRDVVARSVFRALERGAGAYLDLTPIAELDSRFPAYSELTADVGTMLLPIKPFAHFHMGGIKTDIRGRTSVLGLWALGEVACTGLHGANRLASNSLLEIAVGGARVAHALERELNDLKLPREFDRATEIPECDLPISFGFKTSFPIPLV
ncbi:MAG: FAD-dependent oxidoreductase [bacterium]